MALVSPGAEVTIIDESQYTSAGQNTVPYILMATAENKLTPAGTDIAPGTLASAIGDVYLITSQRELANTFGDPTFYKTAGGNALHGYELNEYGLMAAYSVLGATNRAYIQRVDIDMSELEAALVRPAGNPADGTYWFDLTESAYGFFVWNLATNTFDLITPIIITDEADLSGGVPISSVGSIDDYAIVTTNANNPVYRKGSDNLWTLIGSDDWRVNIPTVVGTATSPTYTVGDDLVLNGDTITTTTGTGTLADLVVDINAAAVTGVTAGAVNNRLEIYTDSTATGLGGGNLTIAEGAADDLLTAIGLTAAEYYGPIVAHDSHVNVPRWRTSDSVSRPSGSIWQKTTAVNDGADIVVKKYNSAQDLFVAQTAPLYKNDQTANKFLDPSTGGSAIASGDTYVQYDVNENVTGTFKIFERTTGVTSVTGATPVETTPNDTYTISVSATNDDTLSAPVTITLTGTLAAEFVADLTAANIPGIEASVTTAGLINITHTGGGVIVLEDTLNTPIADAGFSVALNNVRLQGAAGPALILSNWNLLTYTADSVVPGTDPLNGTRWYYSAVDEVDIMIRDSQAPSGWKGYANVINDVRGYVLTATDPLGPTVAATAPVVQQDGITALAFGDLWIDTSNLEEYATIRRWENNVGGITGVTGWILIDNADQTSTNGILFADARWGGVDGSADPVTGDLPAIADLLTDDWTDPDAPDPALYPEGMLLWNTRRSGYNVKEFRVDYFNATDFDLTNFPEQEPDAWVTVSGLKEDGSANFGRLAQRSLVVEAMKAAIDTNSEIREEQRQFNLMAAPAYPELIPNMVALNNERANTSFIVGDSPMRLENSGNAIAEWASNNDGLGTSTNDGLASNDEYMGVFYPSGKTNDLTGTAVVVPPSHMMLRTIIHSDEQSYPWLAPAGVRRGQIDNADAIGYIDAQTGEFKQMSTRQGIRDVLYTNNVNPLTFIPGAGLVNYGNKTTKTGSALDRINVARLVSYIRVQADALSKQFVFEPNDKLTRDEIKGQMERMLNDLIAKRGIFDYLVVCDKSNNTNARIDRNEIWVDLAVEPVKAGEFIFVPVRIRNTGEISGG
jgi:hypothetical protein